MPEDTKKNQQRNRNDPKEQRRRRGRQHPAPIEKKVEKEPEVPKVTVPEKPPYEPPPPEFYKSLKRETDEILKITEEANTKYKKKEILSNWAKYEIPIETYEEINEHENLGADYEALIQAPLSVGSHFQFKHEKSWDIITGPSPYDKYFDINMENLSVALSSIPFYERNTISTSFFNENDIQTMNHRATKFKQKYYNDKKYSTPESETQEKILNNLTNSETSSESTGNYENSTTSAITEEKQNEFKEINFEKCEETNVETVELVDEQVVNDDLNESLSITPNEVVSKVLLKPDTDILNVENIPDVENIVVKELKTADNKENCNASENRTITKSEDIDNNVEDITNNLLLDKNAEKIEPSNKTEMLFRPTLVPNKKVPKAPSPQKEPVQNPVIESPEDLEKWLDDFLDG